MLLGLTLLVTGDTLMSLDPIERFTETAGCGTVASLLNVGAVTMLFKLCNIVNFLASRWHTVLLLDLGTVVMVLDGCGKQRSTVLIVSCLTLPLCTDVLMLMLLNMRQRPLLQRVRVLYAILVWLWLRQNVSS